MIELICAVLLIASFAWYLVKREALVAWALVVTVLLGAVIMKVI